MTTATAESRCKVVLGEGVLTWARNERVSDRYGTVYLIPEGHNSLTRKPSESLLKNWPAIAGQTGMLVAEVTAVRDSTHIGDLFRGIRPRRPKLNAKIPLGTGHLFFEPAPDGGWQVGLRPEDGRANDWLRPRALYDAHEQSVRLWFEPA